MTIVGSTTVGFQSQTLSFSSSDINTLDWGKSHLAVGLGNAVFLWNPTSGDTQMLMEMGGRDYVSSVSWAGNGRYLAIGGSDASVQLWDVEKQRRLRTMTGHTNRVGVLTWNAHMLVRYCNLLQQPNITI